MRIEVLMAKINAVVTGTDFECDGSITIDETLMKQAGLYRFQVVHVNNISQPNQRIITYVLPGKNGEITLNGAAAHCAKKGDKIHINAYGNIELGEEFHTKVTDLLKNERKQ